MRGRIARVVLTLTAVVVVTPACTLLGGNGDDAVLCGGLTEVAGVCVDDPVPDLSPLP